MAAWTGISGEKMSGFDQGGPDFSKVSKEWLRENIQIGPLGKVYPDYKFIMEGDTPTFLYLIQNGLGSPEHPEWGGWGGRYQLLDLGGASRYYGDACDKVVGLDGRTYKTNQGTIWRWRDQFQNSFAARIQWTLSSDPSKANHAPIAIVNGSTPGPEPLMLEAEAGTELTFDASKSHDPDGDELTFSWFHYKDVPSASGWMAAAMWDEPISFVDLDTAKSGRRVKVQLPSAAKCAVDMVTGKALEKGQVLHFILEVKDNGTPPLTTYKRVVVQTMNKELKGQREKATETVTDALEIVDGGHQFNHRSKMSTVPARPSFSSLPLDKSGPPGNAWGLYGSKDELGSLNLLTPEMVAAAAKEIQTGERVSLDWTIGNPTPPLFDRKPVKVNMYPLGELAINDDEITLNTQCGSQRDGFRHFAYQKARKYYGGRTRQDLYSSHAIGINVWVENGGIVGRGILLDYVGYCEKHGKQLKPLQSGRIPLKDLKEVAEYEGVTPRTGDILFVRTGFTKAYTSLSSEEAKAVSERNNPTDFLGIDSTREMLQWFWESGFAAVAADVPAFEWGPGRGEQVKPGTLWDGETWEADIQGSGLMHQCLLSGWGCPIGEMFYLEQLAEKCRELGRWSFFVTSVPLKVYLSRPIPSCVGRMLTLA
jgi:hypothetical protein